MVVLDSVKDYRHTEAAMSLHVDTLQCVSARTHLQGLKVTVGRSREEFLNNLVALFPHEANGIHKFYGICWDIFRW